MGIEEEVRQLKEKENIFNKTIEENFSLLKEGCLCEGTGNLQNTK